MQQAIPYKTWLPATTAAAAAAAITHQSPPRDVGVRVIISVKKLVEENAVIVFGRRGCCMCHVAKQLLLGLGVNPVIFYVDEEDEAAVTEEMSRINGGGGVEERPQFPAVFIGGKMFGGLERVMATHITGELVPILKEAKALWL